MKWLDNFIVSKRGQWEHPGKLTAVRTDNGIITMEGVPYPVMGFVPGQSPIVMQPGKNYKFPGKMVYEIPMTGYRDTGWITPTRPETGIPWPTTSSQGTARRYSNPMYFGYGGDISIPDLSRPNWLDKAQKGKQVKYYDNLKKYNNANQLYNDSLIVHNAFNGYIQDLKNSNTYDEWRINAHRVPRNTPRVQDAFGNLYDATNYNYGASNTYTKHFSNNHIGYATEYKRPTQKPVYKEKPKEYIPTKTPKLEREPLQLVMPQSDRILDSYNNTRQVLRGIQEEDKSNQNLYPTRVVLAPNFRHGGWLERYQDGSEVTYQGPQLNQVTVQGEKPSWVKDKEGKTPDDINWYETLNFKKWGLKDYSDYSSFNSAFRNARESGEKEFVWNDKRYNTDLIPKATSDKYWDAKRFLKDYYTNEPFTPFDTSSTTLYDFYDDYTKKKYGYTWLDYFDKIKNTPQYLNPKSEEDQNTYDKYQDTLRLLDKPNFYSEYSNEAKAALKDRAKNKYIEALNDPSYYFSITSKPDPKNPTLGYVDGREGKNKIYVSDKGNTNDFTTFVHELSHKGDSKSRIDYYGSNSRIPDVDIDAINKFGTGLTQDRFNYVSDATETEARKMSTLYFMDRVLNKDIKSGKITENDLQELYDTYHKEGGYGSAKSLPDDIQDLLELYKWQQGDLLKYLNNDFNYRKISKRYGGSAKWLEQYQGDEGSSQVPANLPWIGNKGQVLTEQQQEEKLLDKKFGIGPTVDKAEAIKAKERLKKTKRIETPLPSGAITPVMGPVEYALMAPVAASTVSAAAPIIGSGLNASIAGIPGLTAGNALGAGFATDAIVNRLPEIPGQLSRGEYMDAAINAGTGVLDLFGAGMVSPLFKGVKAAKKLPGSPNSGNVVDELREELQREGIVRSQKTLNLPWKNIIRKGVRPWAYDIPEKAGDMHSLVVPRKNPSYITPDEVRKQYEMHKKFITKPGDKDISFEEYMSQINEDQLFMTRGEVVNNRFNKRFAKENPQGFKNRYATWDMYLGKPQTENPMYDISHLTKSKDDVVYTIKEDFMDKPTIQHSLSRMIDDIESGSSKGANIGDSEYPIYRGNVPKKRGDNKWIMLDQDNYFGTMGGFHWDIKKLPNGNYEAYANDVWDLQPNKNAALKNNFLRNLEIGKALGIGKPLNVKVGFEIDKDTKKILKTYGMAPGAVAGAAALKKEKYGGWLDEYPDGGTIKDRLKKRLLNKYPGMQSIYGAEGENLNIIKDRGFMPAEYGYGNIEFINPGTGLVSYTDDYQYQSPTPDKYTIVYNPRGANRKDIALDMLHGMRDDQNYMNLLAPFEKAVRDTRGGDMEYFYNEDVKKGFAEDGQDTWDKNYMDGLLRAEFAGYMAKGRKDYKTERQAASPEMIARAKDIYNYVRGDYEKGGPIATDNQDYNYIKYKDLSLSRGTGWLDNYK